MAYRSRPAGTPGPQAKNGIWKLATLVWSECETPSPPWSAVSEDDGVALQGGPAGDGVQHGADQPSVDRTPARYLSLMNPSA